MTCIKPILPTDLIQQLKALLDSAKSVSIVCHMTPDGDALGSSLFLCRVMRNSGRKATVLVPDQPPANLMFLPGADEIVVASCHPERARRALVDSDLTFCLDFNDLKRIDRLAPMVEQSGTPRIVVDHHLNPAIEAEVVISHPEKSSTSALIFEVIDQLGMADRVDVEAAECCCAGMMTDTGNFSYNSCDPALYLTMARLVEIGVDKDRLYKLLFNTNSLERVRLMGYGQCYKLDLLNAGRGALITLSLDELRQFHYQKGDTEGLVNVPLSIPGVVYSVYLREDEPQFVKVSMRSKGQFSVKHLCEKYFGGGGHLNAAGGELKCGLSEAIEKLLSIQPEIELMLQEIPVED